jgi:hypothetical protein
MQDKRGRRGFLRSGNSPKSTFQAGSCVARQDLDRLGDLDNELRPARIAIFAGAVASWKGKFEKFNSRLGELMDFSGLWFGLGARPDRHRDRAFIAD